MSTATRVPETWELTGDDARATLRRVGTRRLLADSWLRLRVSDGFSHARSLAYTISLVLVQAIIGLVGLATALGARGENSVLVRTLQGAAPGPAGEFLTNAVQQARHAGASGQYLGLTFGVIGSIITGATLMGQMERSLNRLYGVEQDRPTFEKYRLAAVLTLSAGALSAIAFACLAVGRHIGNSMSNDALSTAWSAARWPLGLVVMAVAMCLLFRKSPRRRQPSLSWLALGAAISTGLWALVTAGLGGFFRVSTSFGTTYGPLAGIVALLLWSFLSSVAVMYGAAIAAQLESVRAGEPEPQDEEKVIESGPEPVGAALR